MYKADEFILQNCGEQRRSVEFFAASQTCK